MHTALPNMDCLRSLSAFWIALVGEHKDFCEFGKTTANERRCLWLLTVARASMDVVMSVAASVIFSLLLISGDVEENPGPGPGGIHFKDVGSFLKPCDKFYLCMNECLYRA